MTDSAHYVRMLHPPMVVGGGGRGRKGGKERERVSEHASSVDLWNLWSYN